MFAFASTGGIKKGRQSGQTSINQATRWPNFTKVYVTENLPCVSPIPAIGRKPHRASTPS